MLLRPALPDRGDGALGEPPGGHQEGRVGHHPVLRADGEADRVPRAAAATPRRAARSTRPARAAPPRRWTAASPSPRSRSGRRPGRSAAATVGSTAHGSSMSRTTRSTTSSAGCSARSPSRSDQFSGTSPKKAADVAPGDVGEVLPPLVAGHRSPAARPPAAASRSARRSRPRPRAPASRADVAEADDLRGVLRVDHLGAARHGEHEVLQQRPERQVAGVRRRA